MLSIWQGVGSVRGVARSDEIGDNAGRNPANKRTCEMSKLAKHVNCQNRLRKAKIAGRGLGVLT